VLTGTPTSPGTTSVSISATNALGTDTRTLTINVAAGPTITSGPSADPSFVFANEPVTFTVVATAGALAFSAIGLLTASRARTIEGASGLINLVIVPMWLGSGVFFSYERFPEQLHPLLRALPLTALNDALRVGMIDGAGLAEVFPEMGVLAAWSVVSFALALRIFRWA